MLSSPITIKCKKIISAISHALSNIAKTNLVLLVTLSHLLVLPNLLFPQELFAAQLERTIFTEKSDVGTTNAINGGSKNSAAGKNVSPDKQNSSTGLEKTNTENKLAAPDLGDKAETEKNPAIPKGSEVNCAPRIAKPKTDCAVTHAGVRVKSVPNFVCEFDTDKDGVFDAEDSCPNTPPRTRVYDNGCAVPIMFPEGILYRINSEFDFDKSNLRPDAIKTLNILVKDLKATLHDEQVKIVGHTDSKGSDAYNVKLSKQRASAVAKYLVDQGIKRYSISFDGKGEKEPIATNDTDEGRAINRRIDIRVEGNEEGYKTGKYADDSGCPVPATTATYTLTAQFDTGSADLKPAAIDSLDEILDKLKATPLEEVITIVGHTDARGSDEKNKNLSQNRAQSAADYLVKQGIPKSHVIVEGKGESEPVDTNETKAGRLKNRRIEIRTR